MVVLGNVITTILISFGVVGVIAAVDRFVQSLQDRSDDD